MTNLELSRGPLTRLGGALLVAAVFATCTALVERTFAQGVDEKLGKVHFEVSCTPTAQTLFDRAMLYQHSFWYRASKSGFEDVAKADPACGMAYWGIALSLLWNPHTPPPEKNLAEGAAALAKGKSIGAKTQRERDYLDALGACTTTMTRSTIARASRPMPGRWNNLRMRYPNDDEAQIYYALALNISAPPTDKTYANQLKGADILEQIAKRQPQHPGVAHYLIHLYDSPALAEKGLSAARRYAGIAPAAAHAQHMPSHVFTRVGYWKESIASNAESSRVAALGKESNDQLHAMDYLVYANLQLGQDGRASAIIDEMGKVTGFTETFIPGPYALAASPARYAVERGDWKAAAALPFGPAPCLTYRRSRTLRVPSAPRAGRRCSGRCGDCKAHRTAGQVARSQGCLLVATG